MGAVGKEGPNHKKNSGRLMEDVTIQSGIQHWVVPISGQYKIMVHGASGLPIPSLSSSLSLNLFNDNHYPEVCLKWHKSLF